MYCGKRGRRGFAAPLALQFFMVKNSLTIHGERHILFSKEKVRLRRNEAVSPGKKPAPTGRRNRPARLNFQKKER
jgi:hypothetical protein